MTASNFMSVRTTITRTSGAVIGTWSGDLRQAVEAAVKSGADLRSADLRGANLTYLGYGVDLAGARLAGANLSMAYLAGCNLSSADLEDANLIGSHLIGCNLSGANLIRAHLVGARMQLATLIGAQVVPGTPTAPGARLVSNRSILMIHPIGSREDVLYGYITDKGLILRTGCFIGDEAEFVAALEETHKTNRAILTEYLIALELLKARSRSPAPVYTKVGYSPYSGHYGIGYYVTTVPST